MRTLLIATTFCLTSTASLAIDNCLVGTWRADMAGIAEIMARQMNGSATPVGGQVFMQISADGQTNIIVENMTINVRVPDVPAMDVSVNGGSSGPMTAEGGSWSVVSANYNLVGSANVLGQRMDIPFSSDTGMFGSGSGTYVCGASEVTFTSSTADARIPPRWTR